MIRSCDNETGSAQVEMTKVTLVHNIEAILISRR